VCQQLDVYFIDLNKAMGYLFYQTLDVCVYNWAVTVNLILSAKQRSTLTKV